MQHILVTGGTGTLGSLVVARLRDAGCKLRAALFHDAILLVAQQVARLPLIPLPAGFHF
jgi:nucleoside-diphosphate-sugar epimerase